jgi:hypothetical protein
MDTHFTISVISPFSVMSSDRWDASCGETVDTHGGTLFDVVGYGSGYDECAAETAPDALIRLFDGKFQDTTWPF